jgi:hypothetical protein
MMNVEDELLGWSHSCLTASSGCIRFFGSHLKVEKEFIEVSKLNELSMTHSKHLLTKSMNNVSLHLKACDKVFDPGLRLRPFELVMQRGTPRES